VTERFFEGDEVKNNFQDKKKNPALVCGVKLLSLSTIKYKNEITAEIFVFVEFIFVLD
jgi:hypothetical protein